MLAGAAINPPLNRYRTHTIGVSRLHCAHREGIYTQPGAAMPDPENDLGVDQIPVLIRTVSALW
jgi:hypothetical protein